MAEMRRSFQNVKSLLGKLDRSIDEARSRRLGEPDRDAPTPVSGSGDSGLETVVGRPETPPTPPASTTNTGPGASPAPPTRRSVYGRARPLARPADPTTRWSN